MRFDVNLNELHIVHGIDTNAAPPGSTEQYKLLEKAKEIVSARLENELHLYHNQIPCRVIGETQKQYVVILWREFGEAEKRWVSRKSVTLKPTSANRAREAANAVLDYLLRRAGGTGQVASLTSIIKIYIDRAINDTTWELKNKGQRSLKTFYEQQNIGKCKYVINHHDGVKKHKDGSPQFEIAIFKNKIKKNQFIKKLIDQGYEEN